MRPRTRTRQHPRRRVVEAHSSGTAAERCEQSPKSEFRSPKQTQRMDCSKFKTLRQTASPPGLFCFENSHLCHLSLFRICVPASAGSDFRVSNCHGLELIVGETTMVDSGRGKTMRVHFSRWLTAILFVMGLCGLLLAQAQGTSEEITLIAGRSTVVRAPWPDRPRGRHRPEGRRRPGAHARAGPRPGPQGRLHRPDPLERG